jgi:hypothetical protein
LSERQASEGQSQAETKESGEKKKGKSGENE